MILKILIFNLIVKGQNLFKLNFSKYNMYMFVSGDLMGKPADNVVEAKSDPNDDR